MPAHSVFRFAQILHLLSLALWMGSTAMSGVVAAIVFPTMRKLDPTLGAYPDYTGDHAILGAGQIASKVFLAVDTIQFICASLALGTFIVMLLCGYSLNTLARVLRSILLCGALGLLSYHLLILMPAMNLDLRTYWDAAEIGNTVLADTHKDNFLAMHSTASRTIGGITLVVLVTFFLGLWTAEHPKVSNAPEPA
ncbi:MAG: hypothetical protein JKY96_05325 [Phycisphaerales bacterium]|nr:hypothetical protein [Phycisphaerales bacterium]